MSTITLYKYQNKLTKQISKLFKKGYRSVLAQSATGSGKTVIFSWMAAMAASKSKKTLIITNRTELLTQAGGTLEKFREKPYYIKAGTKYLDRTKKIYVGMSQTLRNRIKQKMWFDFIRNEISLIIIDEAHIQEFNHIFEVEGLLDKCRVVGFTATPARTGKMRQLGLDYEAMAVGLPIKKLIKKGKLVNTDIYNCGSPDMSKVKINAMKGDFSESSMFKQYDSQKLYKGLVKNYDKICPGEKMMVFCCNVHHAIETTKQLNKSGITAKFVSSKIVMPKEPRKWTQVNEVLYNEKLKAHQIYEKYYHKYSGSRGEVIKDFKNNKFTALVNVDMLTTGFDDPGVQVVALYRATTSLTLYLQMLGRGARILDGKTHFTTLDFGGNKDRFGGYDIDRNWSLWHESKESGGGIPPMKTCGEDNKFNKIKGDGKIKKGCERLIMASYKICPFCGFKYPVKNPAKEAELMLASIKDEQGISLKVKSFKDMSFDELTKYRDLKKHSINWLYRMLWSRNKQNTILEYANAYNWKHYRTKKVLEICQNYN